MEISNRDARDIADLLEEVSNKLHPKEDRPLILECYRHATNLQLRMLPGYAY